MNFLHPGPKATAAEKEYEGSKLYWELTKRIDGFKVESMFLPDGTLHSQEIEVPESKIPRAVRSAVALASYGPVRAWEEIQDGRQRLVEYHAKTTWEGRNFKLLVSPTGKLLGIFREIEAEIEVPVR